MREGSPEPTRPQDEYTGYRAVQAEGARIGIAVCKRCGAAICIDPSDDFDAYALHDSWHSAALGGSQETPT